MFTSLRNHCTIARCLVVICLLASGVSIRAQRGVRVTISSPALGADSVIRTTESRLLVTGHVQAPAPIALLRVDEKSLQVGTDGSFSTVLDLKEGENKIPVGAFDTKQNTQVFRFIVIRSDPATDEPRTMPADENQELGSATPVSETPPVVNPPTTVRSSGTDEEEQQELINVHALIIGISKHANDPKINLQYAKKDAMAFYDFVTSDKGLAADPRNVRLLLDQEATRVAILTSIKDMMNSARSDDVFMLYFSGHGEAVGNNREFCFFTYDAITRDPDQLEASAVLQSEVMRQMEFGKTRKKVLFLDACYSGIMAVGGKGTSGHHVELMQRMAETDRTMTILTSSSDSEKSFEDPGLAGGHGIFTYYLIKGLEGNADKARDGNKDGFVTVYELDRFLSDEVNSRAQLTHKARQRPKRVCDRCEDFPLSRSSEYDLDKAAPARISNQTITSAPATAPTPTMPAPQPSGTDRNFQVIKLPPTPKESYEPPKNPAVLSEVVYGNDDGDKITLHGHHYDNIQVSGILEGMVISAPGKIHGDMISFTDDGPRATTKGSFLNLTPDWDGMKVTLNLPSGEKRTHQLTRRGVAKRETLVNRRFREASFSIELCVYHHHYSDIGISGHIGDHILYAQGTQKGDVLEFVDKEKDAYASGRFVLSDDWTALQGYIAFKDGRVVELDLPLSRPDDGYDLNNGKYLNITKDQSIHFYGQHYADINLSGIVGDENIVCKGVVKGDVVLVNTDPKNEKHLPSRLVLREEGKLLKGSIGFKEGAGSLVVVDMKRAKP